MGFEDKRGPEACCFLDARVLEAVVGDLVLVPLYR